MRLAFLFILGLGAAVLFAANFVQGAKTCADTANPFAKGSCHMLAGFHLSQRGEMLPALEEIALAREADPVNPRFPLYECEWLAKIEDYANAIASCEIAIAVAPGNQQIARAAYEQISGAAALAGLPAVKAEACAALAGLPGEKTETCS